MNRKVVTLCAIALLFISFSFENKLPNRIAEPPIAICGGDENSVVKGAIEFNALNPPPVMTRKNIYNLTPTEINSIKAGITAMRALPFNNSNSWIYQAAIHGTLRGENCPSWNTCHKSGDAFFFLAWHRMYVYFFERILRAKSGDPNLTLPYWDYQTNAVLHPDYRNNAVANVLYDGSRNSSINTGGSLPSSIMVAFTNTLTNIPYYDFQNQINGPHGSVHVAIGGNMGSVSTAAQDPVFWLHHANIDRLWEEWLRMCGGRVNPSDSPWLNKTYTFFDETGAAVSMTGSQVVNTATQLSYKYDFPPKLPCNIKRPDIYVYKRWRLCRYADPIVLNYQLLRYKMKEAKPLAISTFIKETNKSKMNAFNSKAPDKFIVEIEGAKVAKLPEGVIEIYLNLGANETPTPKSKSFVGVLDLFSVGHHGHQGTAAPLELDASKAARDLDISVADLGKAQLSFYTRGNTLKGKEVVVKSEVSFQSINLAIESAKQ